MFTFIRICTNVGTQYARIRLLQKPQPHNDNNVIYDNKMFHLSQKLGKSLKDKSESLMLEAIAEIETEYNQKIKQYTECDDLDRVSFYQEKMIEFKSLYEKYSKNIYKLELGDVKCIINKFSKLMSIKLPKSREKDELK